MRPMLKTRVEDHIIGYQLSADLIRYLVVGVVVVLSLIISGEVRSATYNYVVEVDKPFDNKKTFKINDRTRTCQGTTCKWKSSDSLPSVKGCKKMQDKVDRTITAYGHGDRMLGTNDLQKCNGTSGSYQYAARFYSPIQTDKSMRAGNRVMTCREAQNSCTWSSNDSSPSVKGCTRLREQVGRRVLAYGNNKTTLSDSQLEQCNKTGRNRYVANYEGDLGRNIERVVDGEIRTCIASKRECFWYSNDKTPSVEGCKRALHYPMSGVVRITSYGIAGSQTTLDQKKLEQCNGKKKEKVATPFEETKSYRRCSDAIVGLREPKKDVSITGHDFHCYKVKRRSSANSIEYKGKISHVLKFRPDDQMYFRILKQYPSDEQRCKVFVDVEISEGGIAPVPGTIARWVGKDGFEDAWREAAEDWDGKEWEEIGYRLIADASSYLGCR